MADPGWRISHMAYMLLLSLIAGQIMTGTATYYADGVFPTVAANRAMTLPESCPECIGYVSLLQCDDIGRRICISNGIEWVGPLLNVDCAAEHHRPRLVRRGWVADLDYWLAERWQMAGPITVSVAACRAPLHGEME